MIYPDLAIFGIASQWLTFSTLRPARNSWESGGRITAFPRGTAEFNLFQYHDLAVANVSFSETVVR